MIIIVESKKKGIDSEEDSEILQEFLEESVSGNEFLIC